MTFANRDACSSSTAFACTGLGFSEPRTIWIVKRLDLYDEARVLVHELGHIIGLTHDTSNGCVAMTPSLWENCERPPSGKWRCELLAVADIRRATQIVGGTPRPVEGPVFCPKEAARR